MSRGNRQPCNMSQKKQYIVAGGGLAGLSAAVELALHGHSVALYEQSKTLGGRAATHSTRGYAMNIGPHGFYRASVMKAQFDAWGIAYSGKLPLGRGEAYLIAKGRKHRFPGNTAGLLRSTAFSLGDKLKLGQLMGGIAKAKAHPGEAMQAWIDRQSTSANVRDFLAALTRLSTYSANPALLDANAALRQVQLASKSSVLYLDGGWETLVNGLASKARALGVEIHADCGGCRRGRGRSRWGSTNRRTFRCIRSMQPAWLRPAGRWCRLRCTSVRAPPARVRNSSGERI